MLKSSSFVAERGSGRWASKIMDILMQGKDSERKMT
jgi:hypothetical protein